MFTLTAVSTTRGTTLEKINLCREKRKRLSRRGSHLSVYVKGGEKPLGNDLHNNNNTVRLRCSNVLLLPLSRENETSTWCNKIQRNFLLNWRGDYLQVVYVFNNVIWSYVSVRQPVGTNENRLTGTVLRNSNTSNWKQLTEPVPLTPQGTHLNPEEEVFVFLISVVWLSLQIHIFNAAKNIEGLHFFFSQRRVQKVKKQKSK